MALCGGTSDVKEITDEVKQVCDQVKADLESKLGSACAAWEPKSFKSQVRKTRICIEFLKLTQIQFRLLPAPTSS